MLARSQERDLRQWLFEADPARADRELARVAEVARRVDLESDPEGEQPRLDRNPVALQPAPHADGGDVGVHQRLVIGIVIVALGDDLADDFVAALLIGAEMGKG